MQNLKPLLVLFAVLVLIFMGGGYLLLRSKPSISQTGPRTFVPRNQEGEVNEKVTSANYKDYTREEYEMAISEKKVVMLYFTANWCPICREQEPLNMKALDEIGDKQTVGLRLHILDSETTKESGKLAKKYDVTYQHTTVIVGPDGKVSSKYTGPLTVEDLKMRLLEAKKI